MKTAASRFDDKSSGLSLIRAEGRKRESSLKLSRDLKLIPIEAFRLVGKGIGGLVDGRKWKPLARDRMNLAAWLSLHGNADGSRICPAVDTMAEHFGWSRATTFRRLDDLEELRLLDDEKVPDPQGNLKSRLSFEHGTRLRQMSLAAFVSSLPTFLRSEQESHIQYQESQIRQQESHYGRDTTVLTGANRENPAQNRRGRPTVEEIEKEIGDRAKVAARDRRLERERQTSIALSAGSDLTRRNQRVLADFFQPERDQTPPPGFVWDADDRNGLICQSCRLTIPNSRAAIRHHRCRLRGTAAGAGG